MADYDYIIIGGGAAAFAAAIVSCLRLNEESTQMKGGIAWQQS